MDIQFYKGATFENIDHSDKELFDMEYLKCEFINCNFSKANLKNTDFSDCTFNNCNFSLAKVNNTGFKNAQFNTCKLMGIDFSVCNSFLFSVGFRNCHLDYSSFFKNKMKKTVFVGCSIKEVDFEEADLQLAVFDNCDLLSAKFARTNLEKADFRTATNYTFDLEINKVKKAKFSYTGISGLLAKYDIDIVYE